MLGAEAPTGPGDRARAQRGARSACRTARVGRPEVGLRAPPQPPRNPLEPLGRLSACSHPIHPPKSRQVKEYNATGRGVVATMLDTKVGRVSRGIPPHPFWGVCLTPVPALLANDAACVQIDADWTQLLSHTRAQANAPHAFACKYTRTCMLPCFLRRTRIHTHARTHTHTHTHTHPHTHTYTHTCTPAPQRPPLMTSPPI
jgi:hypothetical protein